MLKYRTGTGISLSIEVIEVERETAAFVWINGNQVAKESTGFLYHDSWNQAWEHIRAIAQSRVEQEWRAFKVAVETLNDVLAMVPPET